MDDELYRENLLDHYRHPRNHGTLEHPDCEAEGKNPLCGDEVELDVAVVDGRISAIRFVGNGCAVGDARQVRGARSGHAHGGAAPRRRHAVAARVGRRWRRARLGLSRGAGAGKCDKGVRPFRRIPCPLAGGHLTQQTGTADRQLEAEAIIGVLEVQ